MKVETKPFYQMIKYAKCQIKIFININVNLRYKTELLEKLRWYTYKITTTLAANSPILQNLVPNKSWDIAILSKL